MHCEDARHHLSQRLDGELPPECAAPLNEHLAACSACSDYAADLRALDLDAFAAPEPSADFTARLEHRLRAEPSRRPTSFVIQAVAGMLALAAAIAGFAIGIRLQTAVPTQTDAPPTTIVRSASDVQIRESIDPFGNDTLEGELLAAITQTEPER